MSRFYVILRDFRNRHRHTIRKLGALALIFVPCLWMLWCFKISWVVILVLCFITASCFYCMHHIPLKGISSKVVSGFTFSIFFLLLHIIAFIITFAYIYTQKGIVKNSCDVCVINGESDRNSAIVRDYRTCFYFSTVTFTTLGYGDFHPTEDARGVAVLEAMLGFLFLGLFAGMVVYSLQIINKRHMANYIFTNEKD